jgi:hypothetical protein
VCASVCVCKCVCEREIERERECVCVLRMLIKNSLCFFIFKRLLHGVWRLFLLQLSLLSFLVPLRPFSRTIGVVSMNLTVHF